MSQLRPSLVPSNLLHKGNSSYSAKLRKPHFPLILGSCGCVLPFTSPSYGLLENVVENVFTSLSFLSFIRHDRVTGHSFSFRRTRSEEWKYSVPTGYNSTSQERQAKAGPLPLRGLGGYERDVKRQSGGQGRAVLRTSLSTL